MATPEKSTVQQSIEQVIAPTDTDQAIRSQSHHIAFKAIFVLFAREGHEARRGR